MCNQSNRKIDQEHRLLKSSMCVLEGSVKKAKSGDVRTIQDGMSV